MWLDTRGSREFRRRRSHEAGSGLSHAGEQIHPSLVSTRKTGDVDHELFSSQYGTRAAPGVLQVFNLGAIESSLELEPEGRRAVMLVNLHLRSLEGIA